MSHFRQLVAQLQLHLLQEYPADQWLMTDATTYIFFKERAMSKKPLVPKPEQPPVQQIPSRAAPAVKQPPAPSIAPQAKPVVIAVEPPKPEPQTPSRSFQLTPQAPPNPATDPSALRSLLAQVAPKLVIRDLPATEEELVIPPQVLILCPQNTPASHRAVLDNLCKAISRTWVPCQVIDPTSPEGEKLLASSLKLVLGERAASGNAPFLPIASIEALLLDPQNKIALWKELAARLAP